MTKKSRVGVMSLQPGQSPHTTSPQTLQPSHVHLKVPVHEQVQEQVQVQVHEQVQEQDLASSDCTTLVLSRQSIQLVRNTPVCRSSAAPCRGVTQVTRCFTGLTKLLSNR